jgi:hypothetical protein
VSPRPSALDAHRDHTAAARAHDACYRCGAPAAGFVLTCHLDTYPACLDHGRDLWRCLDPKRYGQTHYWVPRSPG